MEKLVPRLRFPGFEGEWKEKQMKALGKFVGGGTPSKRNEAYWQGDIPWISSSDLADNNIRKINITRFISEEAIANSATKIVPANSILIVSRVGVGKVAVNEFDICTSQDFTSFVPDKSNSIFLAFLLSYKTHELLAFNQGTSIKGFVKSNIEELKINLPELIEQTKIANFLSAVDQKLTHLKKKKTLLEQYKKGMMQKIFNRELRFKDDDGKVFGEWENKPLQSYATFFSGGTPLTSKPQYYNGDIPFIKSGEIDNNKTEQFITEEGLKSSSAKMVSKGDLLYALYGATSGEVAVSQINGAINQAILCIRFDGDVRYLNNYLLLKKQSILSTYLQGGQGNLSADIIKKIRIPYPSVKEQTKIASFLSAIDKKITLVAQQIDGMKGWKKGVLGEVFV